MKKVVFAIQVFSLLAMLPLYIIIELNHANGRLTINNSPTNRDKKVAQKSSGVRLNSANQNPDMVLSMFKIINH
jgi:hypothetical protein